MAKPFSPDKILVTAGPTREMLDPVRFLSNLSTGEMGYAVAREARRRGKKVTLISGPTALKKPAGVRWVAVTSARELEQACRRQFVQNDILIMTAAVCDFTATKPSKQKISRTKTHSLRLMQTPDIVGGLGRRKGKRLVIGFCLETRDWLKRAREKITRKSLDGIVANYYSPAHNPFGKRRINTAFLDAFGNARILKKQSKTQVARKLLDWAEALALDSRKKN